MAADQRGATAVEYALIAAGLGAVVAATAYSVGITTASLAPAVSNWF
jgi:Flp pilus assembly pilin Flp